MENNDDLFDAIYCFNTLHLFLANERQKLLEICLDLITKGGFVFFTVFSEEESSYGKGKELEECTFESKIGRPTHYFTEPDLIKHFKDYNIIETGIIEEQENHGDRGPHTHNLRYILAQKIG